MIHSQVEPVKGVGTMSNRVSTWLYLGHETASQRVLKSKSQTTSSDVHGDVLDWWVSPTRQGLRDEQGLISELHRSSIPASPETNRQIRSSTARRGRDFGVQIKKAKPFE